MFGIDVLFVLYSIVENQNEWIEKQKQKQKQKKRGRKKENFKSLEENSFWNWIVFLFSTNSLNIGHVVWLYSKICVSNAFEYAIM